MSDDPEFPPGTDPNKVAIAEAAMKRRAMALSGNRYQPKIAWTLVPWSESDLRSAIEGDGASPLRVLGTIPLPRSVVFWAGAPLWAQYAYLVLCEVRALNVG